MYPVDTAAIIGYTIAGIAGLVAVIGTFVFVRRRWRRRRRRGRARSIVLSLSDVMETDSQTMMGIHSNLNPIPFGPGEDSGTWAEQQPLVVEDPDAEMGALHGQSPAPPTILPPSRQVATIPVGRSGKEIARLRAEALNSESQQSHNDPMPNVSSSTFSRNVGTEPSGATSLYDPRRLQSEVESLRREMERLRTHTEGLSIGAPPSYTEGDG